MDCLHQTAIGTESATVGIQTQCFVYLLLQLLRNFTNPMSPSSLERHYCFAMQRISGPCLKQVVSIGVVRQVALVDDAGSLLPDIARPPIWLQSCSSCPLHHLADSVSVRYENVLN